MPLWEMLGCDKTKTILSFETGLLYHVRLNNNIANAFVSLVDVMNMTKTLRNLRSAADRTITGLQEWDDVLLKIFNAKRAAYATGFLCSTFLELLAHEKYCLAYKEWWNISQFTEMTQDEIPYLESVITAHERWIETQKTIFGPNPKYDLDQLWFEITDDYLQHRKKNIVSLNGRINVNMIEDLRWGDVSGYKSDQLQFFESCISRRNGLFSREIHNLWIDHVQRAIRLERCETPLDDIQRHWTLDKTSSFMESRRSFSRDLKKRAWDEITPRPLDDPTICAHRIVVLRQRKPKTIDDWFDAQMDMLVEQCHLAVLEQQKDPSVKEFFDAEVDRIRYTWDRWAGDGMLERAQKRSAQMEQQIKMLDVVFNEHKKIKRE